MILCAQEVYLSHLRFSHDNFAPKCMIEQWKCL